MDAYCQRQGVHTSSLRFMVDGERLKPTDTPAALEMEDGDMIDAMAEQTGGF
ncbi:putative small ubiquitin-related modifier [Paratrimastix pyriformis]|uniref:Small ubiquitin-related modifier n=1 Tax=Paratrimastix pyriformis TaxID=342808 RepID=A0ABQ8UM60_9EUKA|nr:putative small ubiquitin-related modifier [Paratrimastix pyriformis]